MYRMIKDKRGIAGWIWILIVLILIIVGYIIYTKYFGITSPVDVLRNVPTGVRTPPTFPG